MKPQKLIAGLVVAHALIASTAFAGNSTGRGAAYKSTKTGVVTVGKSTRNTGKRWSNSQVGQLRGLARQNTPTRVIGLKLGRTEHAVGSKAGQKRISLRPTNQSPYNRRK